MPYGEDHPDLELRLERDRLDVVPDAGYYHRTLETRQRKGGRS